METSDVVPKSGQDQTQTWSSQDHIFYKFDQVQAKYKCWKNGLGIEMDLSPSPVLPTILNLYFTHTKQMVFRILPFNIKQKWQYQMLLWGSGKLYDPK